MFLPLVAQAAMEARFFQYEFQATVPALGTAFPTKQIQNGFHFFCEMLTLSYPTVNAGVDDGVTRLSGVFKSGTNQIGLSSGAINFANIAVPGRQRTVGLAGDPSQGINIPGFPWPYLYESSGSISCDVSNAASVAAIVDFTFTGFLIPTYKIPSASDFWNWLANYNVMGPDNIVNPSNASEIRRGI